MSFFRILAKLPVRKIHSIPHTGSEAMEVVKHNIEQKKFRDALDLVDKIELDYPEYFKAVSIFRGRAMLGLAKEMHLMPEKKERAKKIRLSP
jgi:hypothetical protein